MEPFQHKNQKRRKDNQSKGKAKTSNGDQPSSKSTNGESSSSTNGSETTSPSILFSEVSNSDETNPFEARLSQALDQLAEKRGSTREAGLKNLNEILSLVYSEEFVAKNRMTLKEYLKKCLKGVPTERELAARTLSLFSITDGPSEELFKTFSPILTEMANNPDNLFSVRGAMIECLAILCFISISDEQTVEDLTTMIEEKLLQIDHDFQFLTTCIKPWFLLVSLLPAATTAHVVLPRFISQLSELLQLENLDLRHQVGEAIALLVEANREIEEDFQFQDLDGYLDVSELLMKLDQLAEESNRYQAKKERSKQKSLFKTIRSSIELGTTVSEDLTIQHQSVHFEGWAELCQLNMFRDVLSIGFQHHFRDNELLHQVFGQSIDKNQTAMHLSHIEKRHLKSSHSEVAKARSRNKTKQRSQRTAALSFSNGEPE